MSPADRHLIHEQIAYMQSQIRAGKPLRIRGGASKDFYGTFEPRLPVLDTRGLSGIVHYEPSELMVTVLAGTPLSELESALERQGQYLPFEPPRCVSLLSEEEKTTAPPPLAHCRATVGGAVAAGLSGPARAGMGALREYVLGVQMINGLGQTLRFGGEVMKNVAGYDVSRLMAGSMGMLGVLTAVSLKVLGRPVKETTLAIPMQQEAALEALPKWLSMGLALNASAWFANSQRGRQAPDGTLFLRLRGALSAVMFGQEMLEKQHGAQPAPHFDWDALRDYRHPFFQGEEGAASELGLWRLSVPPTTSVMSVAPALNFGLIEWHGGVRWLWASLQQGQVLQEIAQSWGGTALLFRGPDHSARDGVNNPAPQTWPYQAVWTGSDPVLQRLHHRVKAAFDPHGVFQSRRM